MHRHRVAVLLLLQTSAQKQVPIFIPNRQTCSYFTAWPAQTYSYSLWITFGRSSLVRICQQQHTC